MTVDKAYFIKSRTDFRGNVIALVNRNTEFEPYVVCWKYDFETGTWEHGHYFQDYEEALYRFYQY